MNSVDRGPSRSRVEAGGAVRGSVSVEATEPRAQRALLHRAFDLAFFILGDRGPALDVACRAMARLHAAASRQNRRFTYQPHGRSRGLERLRPPARTRVIVGELQLLQRLVYAESEPYERAAERAKPPAAETMAVRYIKHLVRASLRRNSLHVALGVTRLLYRFQSTQMQELYSLVLQDPDRVPDQAYCRSRKLKLMDELQRRFDGGLTVVRGARGEQHFAPCRDPGTLAPVVLESLERFTPWGSCCHVPPAFDAQSAELAAFAYAGAPDGEHAIENNRIHALIHPPCLRRLVDALGFEPPETVLAIPGLLRPGDGESPRGPAPPRALPLSEDEWRWMEGRLGRPGEPRAAGWGGGPWLRQAMPAARRGARQLRDWLQMLRFAAADAWRLMVRPASVRWRVVVAVVLVGLLGPRLEESGTPPAAPPARPAGKVPQARAPEAATPRARAPRSDSEDVPRTLDLGPRPRRLQDVRTLFVAVQGDEAWAAAWRDALRSALRRHAMLTPAREPGRADAWLYAEPTRGGRSFELTLVNSAGQVLWSGTGQVGAGGGEPLAERVLDDLAAAIRAPQRHSPSSVSPAQ